MNALMYIARTVWILALTQLIPVTFTNAAHFAGPPKQEMMMGLGFGVIFFFLVGRASNECNARDRIGQ